jgi:hypothetical protein
MDAYCWVCVEGESCRQLTEADECLIRAALNRPHSMMHAAHLQISYQSSLHMLVIVGWLCSALQNESLHVVFING